MRQMSEAHFAILRRHMVEVIAIHAELAEEDLGKGVLDPRVLSAVAHAPRHPPVDVQLFLGEGEHRLHREPLVAAECRKAFEQRMGQIMDVGEAPRRRGGGPGRRQSTGATGQCSGSRSSSAQKRAAPSVTVQ